MISRQMSSIDLEEQRGGDILGSEVSISKRYVRLSGVMVERRG